MQGTNCWNMKWSSNGTNWQPAKKYDYEAATDVVSQWEQMERRLLFSETTSNYSLNTDLLNRTRKPVLSHAVDSIQGRMRFASGRGLARLELELMNVGEQMRRLSKA